MAPDEALTWVWPITPKVSNMSDRAVVRRHLGALLTEANAAGIPADVVGRLLLEEVIELWQRERSIEDIASELRFAIENLDPDLEYPFIRP